MGTAGAAIGASIGGPIGAGVGAVAGALTGKISKTIAEPIVQTLLMPHQIQANETERTFQGTFQLTSVVFETVKKKIIGKDLLK